MIAAHHQTGILAALGSAASWALGTVFFKGIGEDFSSMAMTLVKSLFSVLMLTAIVAIVGWEEMSWSAFGWLALSGLLGIAIGDSFFFAALQRLGVHQLIIFLMLGPVITVLLAVVILREQLPLATMLGIALVLGGISLTLWADTRRSEAKATDPWGLLYGLAAMFAMAASLIIAKIGLAGTSSLQGTFTRMAVGLVAMITIAAFRRDIPTWLEPLSRPGMLRRFLVATAVVTFGGFWLSLAAVKNLDLSIANTLIATEPIFALPLAFFWLRERPAKMAWAGASIAFPGTLLLACQP